MSRLQRPAPIARGRPAHESAADTIASLNEAQRQLGAAPMPTEAGLYAVWALGGSPLPVLIHWHGRGPFRRGATAVAARAWHGPIPIPEGY